MQFTTFAAAAILALTSTATAAIAGVKNQCQETIYLTVANSTQTPLEYSIGTNGTYSQPLNIGTGNSYGISKTENYWATTTPKFIFGFTDSISQGLTYWTVISEDGDPFAGEAWRVQPADPGCLPLQAYDEALVHVCQDSSDIWVILC